MRSRILVHVVIDSRRHCASVPLQIISLVPTAPPRIIQLAAASAPHKASPLDCQCLYLRALASLSEGPGGVTVRSGLLAAMVNQLISVDVEIKWQDIVDAMGASA